MITPAIGTMTFSERLRIMLNMPAFHPAGVVPTCVAISPTSVLRCQTSRKGSIKSRLSKCRETNLQSSAISKANPSFPAPSRVKRESAAGSVSLWHYPNRPESSGTRVRPIRATPPPAINCFMPCDFAPGLSLPYPSMRLMPPQMPSPAPSAITKVCNTSTALLKNPYKPRFLPLKRLKKCC